jgi:hypothetical protein
MFAKSIIAMAGAAASLATVNAQVTATGTMVSEHISIVKSPFLNLIMFCRLLGNNQPPCCHYGNSHQPDLLRSSHFPQRYRRFLFVRSP